MTDERSTSTPAEPPTRPPSRRRRRGRFAIIALAGLIGLAGSDASMAAQGPSFSMTAAAVKTSGTSVTVRATLNASPATKVSSYSVCVRSTAGANYDFPHRLNGTLAVGTTYAQTRTMPKGTYWYAGCVLYLGKWIVLGHPGTFTVGAPAQPSTAPGTPSPSPTASATPTSTPSPTATPKPTATPTPTSTPTAPSPTTPPATPASTPPPTNPAGSSMPVGDLPGWKQVFTDDFTTPMSLGSFSSSSYAKRWFAYSGYGDTSGRGSYQPNKVISASSGALDWYVHTSGGVHNVAAMVPMMPASGWGQAYGRYSFRFRADTLPGYKMVAILWPDSDNWGEGEIDFPEVNALTSNQLIYANLYTKGSTSTKTPGPASRFTSGTTANDSGWHTATIEWGPGSVTSWLDGTKLGTFTSGVPDTSFHLVFQVETNLYSAAPADATAGHVQLDWVTVYSRTP